MKEIRFLTHHDAYNGGEVAGFPDAHAAELVNRGIAVEHVRAPQPTMEEEVDENIDEAPEAAEEVEEAEAAEEAPTRSRRRRN